VRLTDQYDGPLRRLEEGMELESIFDGVWYRVFVQDVDGNKQRAQLYYVATGEEEWLHLEDVQPGTLRVVGGGSPADATGGEVSPVLPSATAPAALPAQGAVVVEAGQLSAENQTLVDRYCTAYPGTPNRNPFGVPSLVTAVPFQLEGHECPTGKLGRFERTAKLALLKLVKSVEKQARQEVAEKKKAAVEKKKVEAQLARDVSGPPPLCPSAPCDHPASSFFTPAPPVADGARGDRAGSHAAGYRTRRRRADDA
jgi:hypothetical protein